MKKYPVVNFKTTSEVLDGYGGLLTPYAREILQSILVMSKDQLFQELSKFSKDEVEAFYKSSIRTGVYVDENTRAKWITIPRRYKKQAQYLLTLKLSEKLKQLDKEGSLWK
jgi:hypothetical protein